MGKKITNQTSSTSYSSKTDGNNIKECKIYYLTLSQNTLR